MPAFSQNVLLLSHCLSLVPNSKCIFPLVTLNNSWPNLRPVLKLLYSIICHSLSMDSVVFFLLELLLFQPARQTLCIVSRVMHKKTVELILVGMCVPVCVSHVCSIFVCMCMYMCVPSIYLVAICPSGNCNKLLERGDCLRGVLWVGWSSKNYSQSRPFILRER